MRSSVLVIVLFGLRSWVWCLQPAVVDTCEELESAVHSSDVTSIFVTGNIDTSVCKWPEKETPARLVEISGSSNATLVIGIPDESRGDWQLAPGSTVKLAYLQLLEGSSPLMGLDLNLFRDLSLSSIFLDHVVLVLTQCSSDDQMKRILETLMIQEQDGNARICAMGHREIYADSLVFHSRFGNSIYLTDTIVTCGNKGDFQDANRIGASFKKCKRYPNSILDAPLKVVLPATLAVLLLAVGAMYIVTRKSRKCQPAKASTLTMTSTKLVADVRDAPRMSFVNSMELGFLIGKGNFSSVFYGTYRGAPVAVKALECDSTLVMEATDPLEVVIGRRLAHPNVVRTIAHKKYSWDYFRACGRFEADINSRKSTVSSVDDFYSIEFNQNIEDHGFVRSFLVMEYCSCGSLHSTISKGLLKDKHYMPTALQASMDVARAMEYMHSLDIIHGDLKTQNVLLAEDSQKRIVFKVGDFGLSQFSGTTQIYGCGSVKAMPPEMFTNGLLTQAADVYSYGILLWELLAGKEPYAGWSHHDVIQTVVAGQRPTTGCGWPQCFVDLIEDCWQQSYLERPTFSQILKTLQEIDIQALDAHPTSNSTVETVKDDGVSSV